MLPLNVLDPQGAVVAEPPKSPSNPDQSLVMGYNKPPGAQTYPSPTLQTPSHAETDSSVLKLIPEITNMTNYGKFP